jgi:hypothetical protein
MNSDMAAVEGCQNGSREKRELERRGEEARG